MPRITLTNGTYVVAIEVEGLHGPDVSVHEHGHVVTVCEKGLLETARFPDDADMAQLTAVFRNGTVELSAPARDAVHADVAPV